MGASKYLGEDVTGMERGLQNSDNVCALLKGNKARMLVDVQAGQSDLTAHVQSFPTQEGEADNHDII